MRRPTTAAATALLLACLTGCAAMRVPDDDFPEHSGGRLARTSAPRDDRPPGDTTYILLDLDHRRLYLRRDGEVAPLESFPVAIGQKGWETPTGRFAVTEKIVDPDFLVFDWTDPSKVTGRMPPGPANPLGVRWIGFASAHGWGIGFHGTPNPELLGQAVSHGCVRLRNSDVLKLYDQVYVGTPVLVQDGSSVQNPGH
jgi:lipoprotein-anchoring transpeptidase ErfK/SrfK